MALRWVGLGNSFRESWPSLTHWLETPDWECERREPDHTHVGFKLRFLHGWVEWCHTVQTINWLTLFAFSLLTSSYSGLALWFLSLATSLAKLALPGFSSISQAQAYTLLQANSEDLMRLTHTNTSHRQPDVITETVDTLVGVYWFMIDCNKLSPP